MTFGHGYRIRAGIDLAGFMSALEHFREQGSSLARTMVAKRLGRRVVELVDGGGLGPHRALDQARLDLQADHHECQRTLRRRPLDDFECEIGFAMLDDRIYAFVHAEQHEYHDLLRSLPEFEHWPWYDAEDLPDGIVQEEWDARRETWRALVGAISYRTPLAFQLIGPNVPMVASEEVLRLLPTRDERARLLAKERTLTAAHAATTIEEAMRAVEEHDRWMRSPEGIETLALLCTQIEPGLMLLDDEALAGAR